MKQTSHGAFIAAALLCASTAAHATGTPFTGLLFAAFDDEVSYTIDLGLTIGTFDGDERYVFPLPGLVLTFADLADVRYSVVAADNTDQLPGVPRLLATGFAQPDLVDGSGDGAELLTLADVANDFRVINNGFCGGANPCTASASSPNYAGGDSYGDDLGNSNLIQVAGSLLNDRLPLVLLEGIPRDPDSISEALLPGEFFFDGANLVYTGQITPNVEGQVTGMAPIYVICENVTTGESVTVVRAFQPAWDCDDAGLTINDGDRLRIQVFGSAR